MAMNKAFVERSLVALLFVLVLVVFQMAEHDTQRMLNQHNSGSSATEKPGNLTAYLPLNP